jgi:uncharacterized protein (TIGR00297 family)
VAGAVIAAAIALGAYRVRALTRSGGVAAIVIGALAFAFGGLLVAAAIVILFASGSLLGRVRNSTSDQARSIAPKDARRDAAQVLANGGIATACAIAGGIAALHGSPQASRWMVAALCAIAAASGDTWSTEIGAFTRGQPRRITDMRPVPAGTSGGVTVLGTLAAPIGGAIVGLAGALRPDILVIPAWLAVCGTAGLTGSAFDSVLGATVQGIWRCPRCEQQIETRVHAACGAPATLVRGLSWLDNDGVNGVMTTAGAAVGYVLGAPMA